MSDQLLVNVLTVTVPASGSVTVAHGLKSNGVSVAPKLVLPSGSSPVSAGTITDTEITFNNSAAYEVTATFRVERGVSIEVDADGLEAVRVGSAAAGGTFGGTADALQPTHLSLTGSETFLPTIDVKPYAAAATPDQEQVVIRHTGNTSSSSLIIAAGARGPEASPGAIGGYIRLEPLNLTSYQGVRIFEGWDPDHPDYLPAEAWIGFGQIRLTSSHQQGSGATASSVTLLDGGVSINAGASGAGVKYDLTVDAGSILFSGLMAGITDVTPVAGTPISVASNIVSLSSSIAVNMNATVPQLQLGTGLSGEALVTLVNLGAGAVTLTNAAGGQMKLKTSPLVINQYEAYDFVFAGGYWIQR
jgi:hypothetical protein